jgi:hypothetical protein
MALLLAGCCAACPTRLTSMGVRWQDKRLVVLKEKASKGNPAAQNEVRPFNPSP